jgi:ribosomal protein S18 acetylase RimI-like enzyme
VSDAIRIETAASLELADCRRLVLGSEPWITFGYGDPDAEAIARSSAADNLIVARADDRVVGFALSTPGILLGEYLKLLAVEPERRTGGIGRRLMAELESRAFARWPNVYLCVSDFNAGARAFYRRIGYEEVGALNDLLLPGKAEILMRKTAGAWRGYRS